MLTLFRYTSILYNINRKDEEKMYQSISKNLILVLNLITVVIIGGTNKAYCGCT